MDVKKPSSRAEAEVLVTSCIDRWNTNGRDQLHTVFLASTPTTDSATFSNLLTALLSSHVVQPRLEVKALSVLFLALCPVTPQASASPEASTSQAQSSVANETPATDALNAPLIDALLDGIWALDAEIDGRKELAAGVEATLFPHMEAGKGVVEQTTLAKTRLSEVVKELIRARIFSRSIVAERLEVPLLLLTGLVEDGSAFTRKGVRMNTANLYKQQKFNLLREENEGYAGLINELVGGMGPTVIAVRDPPLEASVPDAPRLQTKPDTSPVRVLEQESAEERNARARKVMSNVSALIGYFDLDPNRVVDIILDAFSSNVVGHWPFFLALLAASPWGPDRHKRTKQQATDALAMDVDETPPQLPNPTIGPVDMSLENDTGNNTMAQVLGFKFGVYHTVDETPEELYFMSALLIREGYVRFADLYTHLTPDEAGINKLHATYRASLTSSTGAAPKANALTMAEPLASDGYGAGTSAAAAAVAAAAAAKRAEEAAAKEPPNQVAGLLKALLAVGQLKHALFILSRYPWMCGAVPGVAELYGRLLRVTLEPAGAKVSMLSLYPHPPSETERSERESRRRDPSLPPKLVLGMEVPEPTPTPLLRQVFFYPSWRRDLPAIEAPEILSTFLPLLRILGLHLARDALLMKLFARLAKLGVRIEQKKSPEEAQEGVAAWMEVVRSILLPALSCSQERESYDLVDEVWLVIYRLPYAERFALYGEWKYELYRKPELKARQLATERQAKGILKRISHENLKQSAYDLAKAAQGNPTVFFTVALNQIQSYENLIPPIVECAKYLSEFGYDVFTFTLLDALSNPEKERTKSDGTNISLWLKSLASFAGLVYRRYKVMDVGPVLQYMANQLQVNNVKDLVLVRELVLKMAGIEPLANLADNQVAALTGGRLLRREAMMVANAGIGTDERQMFREGGERLLKALEHSRMTMPLLILIAQQHQSCTFLVPEAEAQPKYMGNLYDTCQETLFQYVEFLHNQLSPAQYAALVPSLKDLCTRFGIDAPIAFHIARPRLHYVLKAEEAAEAEEALRVKNKALAEAKAKKAAEEDAAAAAAAEAAKKDSVEPKAEDIDIKAEAAEDATASGIVAPAEAMEEDTAPTGESVAIAESVAATNGENKLVSPAALAVAEQQPKPIWRASLREAIEASEEVLPDSARVVLGAHFHATFWQLALSDIAVPSERYEQEQKMLNSVAASKEDPRRARQSGDSDREVRDREMRNLVLDSITDLKAEHKAQTLGHFATRKRLNLEKDHWFAPTTSSARRLQTVSQLLQYCVLPRALLSPTDAIFSARFIKLMQTLGTRCFSSLTAYDKIFTEHVASTIFFCTENEARNYSRFLLQLLSDLAPWYQDEAVFKKEAHSDRLPGFQMKWMNRVGGEVVPEHDLLGWSGFRKIMHKWHGSLRRAFVDCLTSKEYMRIRNAIVVLTKLAPLFPMLASDGLDLLAAVQKLATEEKRADLKVLGQGLLAVLKKRQPKWVDANPNSATAPSKSEAQSSQAQTADPAAAAASTGSAALPTGPKSGIAGLPSIPSGPRGRNLPQSTRLPTQPQPAARGPSGLGPNQSHPGANGGTQQQQTNGRNTPTGPASTSSRPPVSRMSSASLPARPRDAPTPQQQQQQSQKTEQPQRNAQPTSRDQEAASAAAAARQAALNSMHAPKQPADTASAVAARERGGAVRSGNVTPSHDRVSRDEPTESARPARQESSRDVSPSRASRSRAASPAGSAHSAAKSQSARRDGYDEAERERSSRAGDRERTDRAPDMYAARRERERQHDERDRQHHASRRPGEPSSRSGDRDSDRRGRGGTRHERSSSGRHESRTKEQDDAASSSSRNRRTEGRDAEVEPASKRRHRDERDAEPKSSRVDTPSGPVAERAPRSAPDSTASPSAGQKRTFSSRIGAIDAAAGPEHNAPEAAEAIDAPDSKRLKIKGRGSETAEAAYREREREHERIASSGHVPPQGPRATARPLGAPPAQESSGHVVSIRGNARAADERSGSSSRPPRPEPSALAWGSRDQERHDERRGGGRRKGGSDRDRKAQRKDRRAGGEH